MIIDSIFRRSHVLSGVWEFNLPELSEVWDCELPKLSELLLRDYVYQIEVGVLNCRTRTLCWE